MVMNNATAPNFMRPAMEPVMIAQVMAAHANWKTTSTIPGYVEPDAASEPSAIAWVMPPSPIWSNPPKNDSEPSPPYANDHPQAIHVSATMPITITGMIIVLITFLRRERPP